MSSSLTRKVCFNSNCKEASEIWRNGWRRRTGEYAHLCDRCALAYEEGKFCETFHSNASGWRCCESCGKQIHCGCIVSFHLFVLLDAGGIECLTCAKKSYILTPNPAWPPPSQFLPSQPERIKDFSLNTWSSIVGSGPVPWRQAPGLFKESSIPSNVPLRMPFEIGLSCGADVFGNCQRLSTTSEKKQEVSDDRLYNGKLRIGPFHKIQNGHAVPNSNELPYLSINNARQTIFPKNDSSSNFSVAVASSSKIELDDTVQLSPPLSQPLTFSSPLGKPVGSQYKMDSSEFQAHNGKVREDVRGHNRLLPRYRPQITDEELIKISSNSKSMITPLFEKTLSASDAGRIGRLVLPKKCAEAYFPPIAHPEGLPLKVQDMKGKEWVFQFRFWPNNNSRMYVLEGITPCIQSMHLQAGDVVMFSRLEPEGKLVMGGRKASNVLFPCQGDETTMKGNDVLNPEDNSAINKCGEGFLLNSQMKGRSSCDFMLINQVAKTDTGIESLQDRSLNRNKRKCSILIVKSKRLRFDNDGHLMLTMAEAQRLIRPQSKIVPSVVVVDGYEFEEFEDAAPVVGRPTIPAINDNGEQLQWVQCEECCKWRKVPADALLPSRWICSENVWDLDVSRCSDLEELSVERLEDVLPFTSNVSSDKKETPKQEADLIVAQEPLSNFAIQGEDEGASASSGTRSQHPRHRPGCTCIVCIPSPSGRCCEHAQSRSPLKNTCKVLLDASQKEQVSEPASQKLQWHQLVAQATEAQGGNDMGNSILNQDDDQKQSCFNDQSAKKHSTSPLKGQIDLNIQPEREEESLPVAAETFCMQQKPPDAGVTQILVGKQIQKDGIGGVNLVGCVAVDGSNPKI